MKSFRPYFRFGTPPTKPLKNRNDYSLEETMSLREQFDDAWERYRQKVRFVMCSLISVAIAVVGGLFFAREVGEWMLVMVLGLLVIIAIIAVWVRFPRCPACDMDIDEDLGDYCPSCGDRSLERHAIFYGATCQGCRTSVRFGKGRQFKICFCTHCGIHLSDHGV